MFKGIASRVVGWTLGLVGIVVVYAVVNGVLVGGQKLWHLKDQKRLDAIQAELATLEQSVSGSQSVVEDLELSLESDHDRLESLAGQIESIEARHADGIPEDIYGAYCQLVDQHNGLATTLNTRFEKYESACARYSDAVDVYNLKVNEANAIAKGIGATWYVVPVPLPGKVGRSAR